MSDTLYRLVYCSRNTMSGTPGAMRAEIQQILLSARRNNAGRGVTGALLFNRGCFAQVLEGSQSDVEHLFEEIACDTRHKDVTMLEVAPAAGRSFGDWSMAYAGMIEDDRATFAALTLTPSHGAENVLALLDAVVLRQEDASPP